MPLINEHLGKTALNVLTQIISVQIFPEENCAVE